MSSEKEYIAGLHQWNTETGKSEIFLTPQSDIIYLFICYFHEVGHSLGRLYSFVKGDVLTAKECATTRVRLSPDEAIKIRLYMMAEPTNIPFKMQGALKNIADRIVSVYTKGKWDPTSITFANAHSDALAQRILDQDAGVINSTIVHEDLSVESRYTRAGRNEEIPSMTAEVNCLKILSNTIKRELESPVTEEFPKTSHTRARLLVDYLQKRGKNPPSIVDQKRT